MGMGGSQLLFTGKDETRGGSVICPHHTAPVSLPRWGRLATACGGNNNKDIDGLHVLLFTQEGYFKTFSSQQLVRYY